MLAGVVSLISTRVSGDQIQLTAILPKLEAIHEDAKSLLLKNSELKPKIQAGLQPQNVKLTGNSQTTVSPPAQPMARPATDQNGAVIDFSELAEFNKWVDTNLEYAVKNTHASIEALKDEAQLNNGNVDYSEQAIQDGIEGVKYWQSAVIFQDKTLKNEKFDSD